MWGNKADCVCVVQTFVHLDHWLQWPSMCSVSRSYFIDFIMVLMPTDRVCNVCESKHTHGFDRFPFGPVMLCFITFYCIVFSVITSVYLHYCVQMSKSQWMRSCGQNKFDFTLQFAIVLMILKEIRLFFLFCLSSFALLK